MSEETKSEQIARLQREIVERQMLLNFLILGDQRIQVTMPAESALVETKRRSVSARLGRGKRRSGFAALRNRPTPGQSRNMTQPHRISDTFPFKSLSPLARPVQVVEELAEYFGSVRLQLAYGQCLGKRSFTVDIVFLELLQEARVLAEST